MNNYENIVSIIIPSREFDFLLKKTITKIRLLYKQVKIVLILDNIDFNDNIDENITVLKSLSHTMSAKRNQGVKAVNTEYIVFLDSDAYPSGGGDLLKTGISFLNTNKEYSAVYGQWYNPDTDDLFQRCVRIQRFMPIFARKEWSKIIDKNAKEQDSQEFISANVILRRNDFINAGMMNENIYLGEDIEFSFRFVQQGYKIRFIPSVSVYHRESSIYPYLKKVYCSGYYYSNMLINGRCQKQLKTFENYYRKTSLWYIYPLCLFLIWCFLFILFLVLHLSVLPLFICALLVLLTIAHSSYKACFKLDKNKIKGFFIIYFVSVLFCAVYVLSSFMGILNLPSKSVYDMFKQY